MYNVCHGRSSAVLDREKGSLMLLLCCYRVDELLFSSFQNHRV
jgi:hypothetical protein